MTRALSHRTTRRGWTLAVLGGVLGLLLAPTLARAGVTDRWERRLDRLEDDLGSGQWKDAMEESRELREKMIRQVGDARELLPLAARSLVIQAVAEANLGRDDDARWHFYAAQSWIADLPRLDLDGYGRAREVLSGLSARNAEPWAGAAARPPAADDRPESYREVSVRRAVQPEYPKPLRKSGMQGSVHVELVIDASGRPRRPRVVDAGLVPTMAFPALDALRLWQFEPARRDGEELAVLYELRIDYR